MLQSFRHRRYQLILAILLVFLQSSAFANDAFAATATDASNDHAHHLLLDSDTPQPPLTDINENCDHCCLCEGHSSHLALLSLPLAAAPLFHNSLAVFPVSAAPLSLLDAIYRPPIG